MCLLNSPTYTATWFLSVFLCVLITEKQIHWYYLTHFSNLREVSVEHWEMTSIDRKRRIEIMSRLSDIRETVLLWLCAQSVWTPPLVLCTTFICSNDSRLLVDGHFSTSNMGRKLVRQQRMRLWSHSTLFGGHCCHVNENVKPPRHLGSERKG